MIASCPHCKNGFYIVPDMAGEVVTCSKCKKKVRAPDRRGQSANAPKRPDDGILSAIIEETRDEMEERLKNEAEARIAAETRLAEIEGAKVQAEELSKQQAQTLSQLEKQVAELSQAKQDLVERLKTVGNAQAGDDGQKAALLEAEIAAREKAQEETRQASAKITALEEEIKTLQAAKEQTEQKLLDTEKQVPEMEQKYQQEARAHQTTQQKLATESQAKTALETKLKAETERRIKVEAELKVKAELSEQLAKEEQKRTQLEEQLKAETSARLRSQAQLENEVEKRNKLQKEIAVMQMQIGPGSGSPAPAVKTVEKRERLAGLQKGLLRMAIVLSLPGAFAGTLFALKNGYIINSHFDRPMTLPFFDQPRLVPINLILISIAGFLAVWAIYLLVRFIVKGFASQGAQTASTFKSQANNRLMREENTEPQSQLVSGMWRN